MAKRHAGHWKSDQTTMVTGAVAGPRAGESRGSAFFRLRPKRIAYAACTSAGAIPSWTFWAIIAAAGAQALQERAS
jgi:hypothetical protein